MIKTKTTVLAYIYVSNDTSSDRIEQAEQRLCFLLPYWLAYIDTLVLRFKTT